MSFIKIVSVPPGEPPEWVRKIWVGLQFPLFVGQVPAHPRGVLSRRRESFDGYYVRTKDAMHALRIRSDKAFRWWQENVPLDATPLLAFAKDACEVIGAGPP